MADLSHWDFAATFSGIQAASLILGIDPNDAWEEEGKILPVFERMKVDYENAYDLAEMDFRFNRKPPDRLQFPKYLYTEMMLEPASYDPFNESLENLDKSAREFSEKKIARDEIARWLGANGLSSVYKFGGESKHDRPAGPRWPWGDHHTELLGHLEAAAREFWVNYDPQKNKETAPKNQVVAAWLRERGVSNSMATAIATILRLDGLPTGPRK